MDIRRLPDGSWISEKLGARSTLILTPGWLKAREAVLTACSRNTSFRTVPMTSRPVAAVFDKALVGCAF